MSTQGYTTLIDVQELQRLLDSRANELVVFDARFDLAAPDAGRQGYFAGHIPTAHYLHLDDDLSGPKSGTNGRHPLPDRGKLAALLGSKGLSSMRGQQVVVYDEQAGMFAARAWWLLRWLGYSRVAVLDGGLSAWRSADLPMETHLPTSISAQFVPSTSLVRTVDADTVLASLSTGEKLIVDARSPDRYRGENETLDPVGGHIPGARNRFFRDNLLANGQFKDAQRLRGEFLELFENTPADQVILQCGSGVTACHNALALEIAGLPRSTLYAGSWSEWVASASRPIETGPEKRTQHGQPGATN